METKEIKAAINGLVDAKMYGCNLWQELVTRLINIYEIEENKKAMDFWQKLLYI